MAAIVSVSKKGEQRIALGHPWIYRSDITGVEAGAGAIVAVRGPRGGVIGHALFSDRSQITLRMLTRGERPAEAQRQMVWALLTSAEFRFNY